MLSSASTTTDHSEPMVTSTVAEPDTLIRSNPLSSRRSVATTPEPRVTAQPAASIAIVAKTSVRLMLANLLLRAPIRVGEEGRSDLPADQLTLADGHDDGVHPRVAHGPIDRRLHFVSMVT